MFVARVGLLKTYDRHCPFNRYWKLEYHALPSNFRRRLDRLGQQSKTANLLTQAWQIASHPSRLKAFPSFERVLGVKAVAEEGFDGLKID